MTVRHIVMWNVRGERGSAEHRANLLTLKEAFEGLKGQVPGLLKIEIGLDFSAVDYACDAVLYSEFDSAASLQAYAHHPAHLAAKERVGDMRTARHQVDYVLE
jgi:antibiotic biosynthesis monooxygenase (ABM) superfamily enzyme